MADLSAVFSNISPNTLKKDLQYLRDEQILTMIGERKSSVYMLIE
jgi:Fic family protein